jgi:hypothetical protein
MKFRRLWVIGAVFAALTYIVVASELRATTINEVELGQTASATPTSVGTSTPVPVLHCSSILNVNNPEIPKTATQYAHVCVTGGTTGTDGCYVSWAPDALPCAAASPAPNASTKVGLFIPTGGLAWGCQDINYPAASGGFGARVLSQEMDAVCTAASMSVSRVTLP